MQAKPVLMESIPILTVSDPNIGIIGSHIRNKLQ